MQRLNLYTGQGGVTVVTTGIASTTKVLGIFPGATVSVFNQGTVVLASIFGDNGITPKSNPFVSDSTTGLAFFYAANGRYDIQLSGTGFSTFTLADIELTDISDPTVIASLTVTGNAAIGGNETVGGTLGVTGAVTAGSYTNNLSAFAPTTSAQLASIITDETGSGALVFGTAPTITNANLVTPTLGVATATTVNKVTLTPPASTATLTIANNKTFAATSSTTIAGVDGKTLTVNNSLTLAGTDGTTLTGPASPPTGGVLAFGVPKFQQFTGNGTFTIPTGVTGVKVTVIGGGGAGGGGSAVASGQGGNAGGTGIKWLSALTPGNTLAVVVGGGGTGNSAAAGNNGVASSVASGTQTISTITAPAGAGGTGPGGTGTSPAAGTGGDFNLPGNPGALMPSGVDMGGNGGPAFLGGAGLAGFAGANGTVAGGFGSGGGGGGGKTGNTTGGAGLAGTVIFEWVQ